MADLLLPLNVSHQQGHFSRVVLDDQGRLLRAFSDDKGVWRQPVTLSEVSDNYLEALLGYEDQWFWYHPGINPLAFVRALFQNIKCGCVVSGGSTISMQVVKFFHPHSRTLLGKIQQVLRTFQLEFHYSKKEILALYLNNAPFGGVIEGVQAASQTYLEKNANELTDAEAALLTVLPQAPSRLRPDKHPQRAKVARDKVLTRMSQLSIWSQPRIDQAYKESVMSHKAARPMHSAILARNLTKKYSLKNVIPTYIDLDVQRALQEFVKDRVESLPEKSSLAVLVMENNSGKIKAHVASADFNNHQRFGHVDMVSAIRSPGSTLKPFIYGLAIDEGLIHSHSLLLDAPRVLGKYRPKNFNRHFNGPVSTTFALQKSLNLPAVQVLEAYGPKRFNANLKNAGVSLKFPGEANLSLALGGAGMNLSSLVALYSSLANEGQVTPLLYSQLDQVKASRFLMSKQAAWVVYKILSSAPRPDRMHGSMFNFKTNPIAWKTGTSYGYRDAWAVGVSKNYTVGVWVGRPDGTPQPGHYGAATAAPILFKVMESLPGLRQVVELPEQVSLQSVCWPLGLQMAKTQSDHCHLELQAWVVAGKVPPTLAEPGLLVWRANPYKIWLDKNTNKLVDQNCASTQKVAKTIALWPRVIEPWVAYKRRFYGQLPKVDSSCKQPPEISVRPLSISSLETGNIFRLSAVGDVLPIKLLALGGQGRRDWYINGEFVATAKDGLQVNHNLSDIGFFEVVVLDELGNIAKVLIEIRL